MSDPLSDAQLVARCRSGDNDAWRQLVERFSRYVYAISVQAYRLPEHDAEDRAVRQGRSEAGARSEQRHAGRHDRRRCLLRGEHRSRWRGRDPRT